MGSSKTTTTGSQQQQFGNTATSTGGYSNPLAQNFQNNMFGFLNKGLAQANQPLYGQAQVGSYLNNLNDLANSSIASLRGQLARTGGLSGGGLASGATDIGLSRLRQQGNFLANLPLMNREASLESARTYGGLGNQLLGLAPRTQRGTQQGESSGTSQSTTKQSPSILGEIGQGLGIAGSLFGMPAFGNLFGGGGGTSSAPAAPASPFGVGYAGASSPFGAQVGGGLGAGIPSWLPSPYNLPGFGGQ